MILGAVVVVVVGILIFNYFKNINKGAITEVAETKSEQPVKIVEKDGQKFAEGLPTTYTVVKGDHLWKIAEKFYNSGYNYVDIASANKLKNANRLEVGQELTIPNAVVKNATVKTTSDATVKAVNAIDGTSYTTAKGDHLWSIAVRAYGDGYSWTKIYTANKEKIGRNASRLLVGVALTIPR